MKQYAIAGTFSAVILTMALTPICYQRAWAGEQTTSSLPAQGEQIVRDRSDGPGAPQTTAEGSNADLKQGKTIYSRSCSMCHGATGSGAVGPSLRKLKYRMTLEQTVSQIRNPRGVMPRMYPSQLSDQDVIDVATFVYGL